MMNYSIRELDAFSVIGQEVELTNYQKRNIQISTQFWRKFNSNLKKSYLSQSGNWVKYAFMERRNGKLYYFCSIPKRTIIPDNFLYKEIPSYKYLVMEHIGLNEQYEEYAIHDTDNFPIAIGEYVSIEELNEMYEMIEELPDYIVECLDEFISHYGTLEEVVEHKDDIYYYPDCETMTDVAYYYIDELQALGDIPPSLQNYIDYEAYGRDLDMGGCFIETSRGMCEIPY